MPPKFSLACLLNPDRKHKDTEQDPVGNQICVNSPQASYGHFCPSLRASYALRLVLYWPLSYLGEVVQLFRRSSPGGKRAQETETGGSNCDSATV